MARSTINIRFLNPWDGAPLSVELDRDMTATDAIAELLKAGFIPPNPEGYKIAIKGGREINSNESFRTADVADGATLRVVPPTDAGGMRVPETLPITFWMQASRFHLVYALGGLIVGVVAITCGTILFFYGVAGHTAWTAKVLGAESKISDAAPVLFFSL